MVRGPGQRAGLDRAAVLVAARDVLADRGVAGLSMRSVAARLGVAPNALYSHVENRDALVDALLDEELAQVPPPAPDADPRAGLLAVMLATFDLLMERTDLVPLYLARQGSDGPNARALGDAMSVLLVRAGLDEDRAGEAVRVLVVHALGVAALATAPDGRLTTDRLRTQLTTSLGWLLDGALG